MSGSVLASVFRVTGFLFGCSLIFGALLLLGYGTLVVPSVGYCLAGVLFLAAGAIVCGLVAAS